MQMLKGGVLLIITLILFLLTSSMTAIRQDPTSIGVMRKVPKGPDPIHNPPHKKKNNNNNPPHKPHPSLQNRHLIGGERNTSNGISVILFLIILL